MKNKGRRHKAGHDQELSGMSNCKSTIAHLTRPINSMSAKGFAKGKFSKRNIIVVYKLITQKLNKYIIPAKIIIYSSNIITTKKIGYILNYYIYY